MGAMRGGVRAALVDVLCKLQALASALSDVHEWNGVALVFRAECQAPWMDMERDRLLAELRHNHPSVSVLLLLPWRGVAWCGVAS